MKVLQKMAFLMLISLVCSLVYNNIHAAKKPDLRQKRQQTRHIIKHLEKLSAKPTARFEKRHPTGHSFISTNSRAFPIALILMLLVQASAEAALNPHRDWQESANLGQCVKKSRESDFFCEIGANNTLVHVPLPNPGQNLTDFYKITEVKVAFGEIPSYAHRICHQTSHKDIIFCCGVDRNDELACMHLNTTNQKFVLVHAKWSHNPPKDECLEKLGIQEKSLVQKIPPQTFFIFNALNFTHSEKKTNFYASDFCDTYKDACYKEIFSEYNIIRKAFTRFMIALFGNPNHWFKCNNLELFLTQGRCCKSEFSDKKISEQKKLSLLEKRTRFKHGEAMALLSNRMKSIFSTFIDQKQTPPFFIEYSPTMAIRYRPYPPDALILLDNAQAFSNHDPQMFYLGLEYIIKEFLSDDEIVATCAHENAHLVQKLIGRDTDDRDHQYAHDPKNLEINADFNAGLATKNPYIFALLWNRAFYRHGRKTWSPSAHPADDQRSCLNKIFGDALEEMILLLQKLEPILR